MKTIIKTYAVIRRTAIEKSELRSYEWEKKDKIKPQECFVIGGKQSMLRWKNKWLGGNEIMKVVPVEIKILTS